MAKVRLCSVTKYFGKVMAVEDFSLDITDGEFVVLVGSSGCGKTTLLRIIAGLEGVTKGNVYIGERLVNDVPPRKRDIAMVFQGYALYPHMTVYQNMSFVLRLGKIPKAETRKIVKITADLLGISELLNRKPKQLSGGQCQRVALGRAIVRKPKVFLFDEPLSNLDAKLRVSMREELLDLHQRLKTTTIYVTHDQLEAMTMGDRIVVMNEGKIQQVDTPQAVYDFPINKYVAGFIGSPSMNFLSSVIVKKNSSIYIAGENYSLKIPKDKNELLKGYIGKEVILGIRPEYIDIKRNDNQESIFSASVSAVETLGSEKLVHIKVGKECLIVRLDPHVDIKKSEVVEFTVNMNLSHIFDKKTKESVF